MLDGAGHYRIGGVKKVKVDVRIVAATNQNLRTAAADGRFRSDLYHRLSQIRLVVPPLRERADDILPLAEHYLQEQSPGLRFSDDVKGKLKTYPWPGNVRELRNVVVRAAVFASGEQIEISDLPEEFNHSCLRQGSAQPGVSAGPGARGDYASAPGKARSPAQGGGESGNFQKNVAAQNQVLWPDDGAGRFHYRVNDHERTFHSRSQKES